MRSRLAPFGVGAVLVLAGCGAKHDAKAATSSDSTSHSDSSAAARSTASSGVANRDSTKRAATSTHAPGDAAVHATLISGRNAHDSVSFLSAIRAGTRATDAWPKGPAPLAGSILPAKRIVAFYGNPLSATIVRHVTGPEPTQSADPL